MIQVQYRMPVKKQIKGQTVTRWGKWDVMTLNSRAELMEYREGILKGAQIRVYSEPPKSRVTNKIMQHICGVA